mmetsp:Transcript_49265/g.142778  ORF Transcript_49265/g.142778 Transcript_49265/m.142778 type:complete len:334 (+) Transcript_49265:64-1065(+)
MQVLLSRNMTVQANGACQRQGPQAWDWNSYVLFNMCHRDFDLTVTLLAGRSDAYIGIAQCSRELPEKLIDGRGFPEGYALQCRSLQVHGMNGGTSLASGLHGPGWSIGENVRLRYTASTPPSLSASIRDGAFVQLPFSIHQGDYLPCVWLYWANTQLQIASAESRSCNVHSEARHCEEVLGRIWLNGMFTDCTVVCNDEQFQCHRCVLAAASPVWRAAFDSEWQEGKSGTLYIDDSEPAVVEALLKYAYTGSFEGVHPLELLPLAHRYELPHLVAHCVKAMVGQLSAENVVCTVQAMSAFKEDKEVEHFWSKLVTLVREDEKLAEAVMLHVRL